MNWNDHFEKALASARELQRTVGEAALKANEQLQPLIAESVKHAADLQATLAKHATETGTIAQQQTQVAMQRVGEFIKTGSDAMRQSADQARATAQRMTEQSRQVMQATTDAMTKAARDSQQTPPGEKPQT
ncbi:MAG: hypothetical protein JO043_13620 [Candidatus Eremiobacteraeota bacterium]|nr:hypothetical protein [Candidatus Eremiobacteraeota bacterium]